MLNLEKPGVKALVAECTHLVASANELKPDVDDAKRELRNLESRHNDLKTGALSLRQAIAGIHGYLSQPHFVVPAGFERELDEAVGKLK